MYVGHTTLLVRDICRIFFGYSMANELGVVNTRLGGRGTYCAMKLRLIIKLLIAICWALAIAYYVDQ